MKKQANSNQFCTISFSKRFLLLIVLAALLSSCGAFIQAPVPTQPNTKFTQSEQVVCFLRSYTQICEKSSLFSLHLA
jgi:hypothetical protein